MARRGVRRDPGAGADAREGRRADPGRREWLVGLHPVREALRAQRRVLHALHVRRGSTDAALAEVVALAREAGVPVREASPESARPGAAFDLLLEAGPLPALGLEELAAREPAAGPRVLVALDGVEDPQNLGAIARVADGAGAAGLVLTQRHAPPLSPAVSRASAGAIEWLPVARVTNLGRALEALRREDFWILGAEAAGAASVYELPERLAAADRVLVLGAEGRGLRPGVRRRLDVSLRIPLGGMVSSLNVATAAAVLLFELRRRSRVAE